jgi:hypothetical protein
VRKQTFTARWAYAGPDATSCALRGRAGWHSVSVVEHAACSPHSGRPPRLPEARPNGSRSSGRRIQVRTTAGAPPKRRHSTTVAVVPEQSPHRPVACLDGRVEPSALGTRDERVCLTYANVASPEREPHVTQQRSSIVPPGCSAGALPSAGARLRRLGCTHIP